MKIFRRKILKRNRISIIIKINCGSKIIWNLKITRIVRKIKRFIVWIEWIKSLKKAGIIRRKLMIKRGINLTLK